MGLFSTKPMARIMAESESDNSLRRSLGPLSLISLGVGGIIGAGIFTLTGVAAGAERRTRIGDFVCTGRDRMCFRGALLQRIFYDDSDFG